ncbi:MAG: hypothetical protein KAX49_20565 [Halanaerobiales bacterium]|nr:hypothetical protein [Halanaerobiales bacterium]
MIPDEKWTKIFKLRDEIAKTYFNRDLYDYQKEFSNKIIKAVINDTGETICAEFSRQSGKTEALCITDIFLKKFYYLAKRDHGMFAPDFFNVGIFAPQQQQSQTDHERIREYLEKLKLAKVWNFKYAGNNVDRVTIVSPKWPVQNTFCFTLSPTSHAESKTLHMIVFEESQDLIDFKIDKTAIPMGAQTNAVKIFIGTAGYQKCRFKEMLDRLPPSQKIIVDYKRALVDRKKKYEETKNPVHLNYEKHIKHRKLEIGEDSDEFRTQYALEWILARGQFITYDTLMNLETNYRLDMVQEGGVWHLKERCELVCTAGVDWGKVNDSTVLTIVDEQGRIIYWKEFSGDDYTVQIHVISELLMKYFRRCKVVNCDATGTQDMGVDQLRVKLQDKFLSIPVIGVKFSAQSKDQMYKNLSRLMLGLKVDGKFVEEPWIKYPIEWPTVAKDKFLKQFLDLQKEEKNNMWSCHHPDGNAYHDDYTDSLALAVWQEKETVSGWMNYSSKII